MGGVIAGIEATGGAVEHQRLGTPHLHFNGHVVSTYQHCTLEEIAQRIEEELLQPEEVYAYHSWVCREEHMVPEQHERELPQAERDFPEHGGEQNDVLCQLPDYISQDMGRSMWDAERPCTEAEARQEGEAYKETYFADVQFVFTRRQHHWHKRAKGKNKLTEWVPLTACLAKSKGAKKCRQRFPKTKQRSARVKVVCPGVAAKHDLRVSGRRNALGSLLGKRSCVWLSGTTPAFAAVFRSNTNTSPNLRLPLTPKTHDSGCKRKCAEALGTLRHVCRLAQRAQRQTTGYFCGYTAKRQPVGSYELNIAATSLAYLRSKMLGESPQQQWARVVNKVLADLEERGTMRTAPEDFNLAVHAHPHDAMNAEFIRTFRCADFPGARFLERLELEQRLRSRQDVETRRLPPRRRVTGKDHVQDTPWVELYGFRGEHPDLYYLSPWEFMERWEALPLQPPCKKYDHNFTEWLPGGEEY